MKTLKLYYSRARKGFAIRRTLILVPAASPSERAEVIDFLTQKIRDNPKLQFALGILGEESFDIR